MIHATDGLVDVLLSFAAEHDPEAVSTTLAVTPAADLDGTDLPPETPVFTHFYLPDTGRSVTAVFGVDLGTPAGQTQGRFVSHPDGRLVLTREDDLHEVVFVAVPPWTRDSLAVFERDGTRRSLSVVDADPPVESLS